MVGGETGEIGPSRHRSGVGGVRQPSYETLEVRLLTVAVETLLVQFVGQCEGQVLSQHRLEVGLADRGDILDGDGESCR